MAADFKVHLTGTENSLPKPSQLRSPNPKIRITGRRSQNTGRSDSLQ